jgi:RNA polymerase sigma-70 factor (ECF subfamily)
MAKVTQPVGVTKQSANRTIDEPPEDTAPNAAPDGPGVHPTRDVREERPLAETPVSGHCVFERLYREELAFVERTVQRYGVPARDAADLTQEIFAVVYRRISIYDESRPARPWLYAFAVRVAKDYRALSRHRLEKVCASPPDIISEAPSAEQMLLAHAEQQIAVMALERLPAHLRRVLVLHDVEEMKMPEIAKKLGIPLDTGYTQLRRARAQLKSRLAPHLESRGYRTFTAKPGKVKEVVLHLALRYTPEPNADSPDSPLWQQAA